MDFHPQRKGSFLSSSRRLYQISSNSVKNFDRESAHRQTDRHAHAHKVKTLSRPFTTFTWRRRWHQTQTGKRQWSLADAESYCFSCISVVCQMIDWHTTDMQEKQ